MWRLAVDRPLQSPIDATSEDRGWVLGHSFRLSGGEIEGRMLPLELPQTSLLTVYYVQNTC